MRINQVRRQASKMENLLAQESQSQASSSSAQLKTITNTTTRSTTIRRSWSLLVVILLISLAIFSPHHHQAAALTTEHSDGSEATSGAGENQVSQERSNLPRPDTTSHQPSNHRMEPVGQAETEAEKDGGKRPKSARNGRQYDGTMSTSSTGNYVALSGDSGAYVGGGGGSGMPSLAASYGSTGPSAGGGLSAYAGDPMNSNMYSPAASGAYHDQLSLAARAAGYPGMHAAGGYPGGPMPPPPSPGSYSPLATMFTSGGGNGGLFSSSSGFPLMAKGFDLAEIVCTAIAVAIGAVIVGAPFILLYLFVMNQMQGNGPSAIGPSGGAISLTGPSSSTTVTGRKKRHTTLSDALFKQLSPLVNNEQVAQTFKVLLNSLAKYEI